MPKTIPIACSLDQADLSERGAQMAELGEALTAVSAEGAAARLRFPIERRAELDAFVAAESSCCSFFSFEQVESDDEVELRVSAPEEGAWGVRGLVAGFVAGWGAVIAARLQT